MLEVELTELQEQVIGMKRGWFRMSGEVGSDMLLGLEIIKRLTEKRSAIVARSIEVLVAL